MQEDIIKDIRQRCRLMMNGVASTSMRQHGLTYKLNFGLVIQQIKELANQYEPNANLAETLWKDGTRELKILGTLLYPIDEFIPEIANRWAAEIPNQEIREQVCANLFQNMTFAQDIATEWSNNSDKEIRTTGYWLLARLLLSKKIENKINIDSLNNVWEDISDENIFLRNSAILVLKHIGRQSQDDAKTILEQLSDYKNNTDILKKEIYNNVSFEFEFYWGI